MNFCKDCKHAIFDNANPNRMQCGNPKNSMQTKDAATYAVTGIEQPTINAMLAASCVAMRTYDKHPALGIDLCGPDGRWWETK